MQNGPKAYWLRYVQNAFVGKEAVCDSFWCRLETLYAEPQRHYHNMFHMNLLSAEVDRTV